MATLHVRNVPDELYELLRERAAANDRSIGAETCQLLQQALALSYAAQPPRRLPFPSRRRPGSGPFTRFTPEARGAVVVAQDEARALGHGHVGTEHLLLGVLAQDIEGLGLTADDVRTQLEPGNEHPTGRLSFHPEAKRALELALRASVQRGDDVITPEHMLAGIAGSEGRGTELLRSATRDVNVPPQPKPLGFPETSFLVVLLEGEAADWESQLNACAALGYELVEIADRRAIFRR
jgi:hypothetical protein